MMTHKDTLKNNMSTNHGMMKESLERAHAMGETAINMIYTEHKDHTGLCEEDLHCVALSLQIMEISKRMLSLAK